MGWVLEGFRATGPITPLLMHVWLVAQEASEENFSVFMQEFLGLPNRNAQGSLLFAFIHLTQRPCRWCVLPMKEPLPWRCHLNLP